MDGDWIVLVYGNGEMILDQSPKLYVNDDTEQDLIEQYNKRLEERMEGNDGGDSDIDA